MAPLTQLGQNSIQPRHPCFMPKKKKEVKSFFKIILPSTVPDSRLVIPRKFVENLGEKLSDVAELKVPSGRVWYIGLKKSDGGVWFQNGFKEFAEYYSIRAGHFLVFRYEGKSKFYVNIYDASASEIDHLSNSDKPNHGLGSPVPKQNEGEDEVEILDASRCYTRPPVVEIIDEDQTTEGMGKPPVSKPGKSNSIKKRSVSTYEIETRCNKKRMTNHDIGCVAPQQNEAEKDLVDVFPCQNLAPAEKIFDEVQKTKGTANVQVSQRLIKLASKSNSVEKSSISSCEIETRCNKKRMPNLDIGYLEPGQNEFEEELVANLDVFPRQSPAPVEEILDEVQKTKGTGNAQVSQRPTEFSSKSNSVEKSSLSTCETEARCSKKRMPNHDIPCLAPGQNESEEDSVDISDVFPSQSFSPVKEILDEVQKIKETGNAQVSQRPIKWAGKSNSVEKRSLPPCEVETRCNKKRMLNHDLRFPVPEQNESEEDSVDISDVFPSQSLALGAEIGEGYQVQRTNRMGKPSVIQCSLRAGQSSSVKRSRSNCEIGTASNHKRIPNHEAEGRHTDGCEGQTTKKMGTSLPRSNTSPAQTNLVKKTDSVCETDKIRTNKRIDRSFASVKCQSCNHVPKTSGYIFKQDVHATKQGGDTLAPDLCALALLRTKASSKENFEVLQEARDFKSENPFFIINIQPSYVYKSLNIPFQFMKAYFGEQDVEVKLRVCGRTWRVGCRIYDANNGISKLYTGWHAFSKENGLKVGDVCVFELIREERVVFNVHIFRV